jgi:hypothetical protein
MDTELVKCRTCASTIPAGVRYCSHCGTAATESDVSAGRTSAPENIAWWVAVGSGAVVLLTAFMPWSWVAAYDPSMVAEGTAGVPSRIGLASGPTAWLAIVLAVLAATIVLARLVPSIVLPHAVRRPVALATWVAGAGLLCSIIRAATIGPSTPTELDFIANQEGPRFGVVIAILAAMVQVIALVVGARLTSTSIAPDLGLSLQPDAEERRLPREVRAAAVIAFIVAALNTIAALAILVLAAGLSSVPLLDNFGAAVAVIAIIFIALTAWLIVLGVQLLAGRRWARTGTLITASAIAVIVVLSMLSTNGDPTLAVILTALAVAVVILLCTRRARTFAWVGPSGRGAFRA